METQDCLTEYAIDAIHSYLGNRFSSLHRESLCIRYAEFAAYYSRMGNHANAKRLLGKAFLKSPSVFFTSPNVKNCLTREFEFHVLRPVKIARYWSVRGYQKTRIWAGAHRRRWKAAEGRQRIANL